MLALLSPAKSLDATPRPDVPGTTTPDFLDEAEALVTRLRKFTPAKLATLMDVSEKLAADNHERYQVWTREAAPETAVPAVFMFRGDVYQGLDADSLDPKHLTFAQKHLRILSGLYGLLRPLDLVRPYRLVMGTEFPTGKPKTLYDFWGTKIADALNAEVAADKKPTVINLASNEYFKAVDLDALCARVVTPTFKQLQGDEDGQGGKPVMNAFFAKKARGLMARYMITNRLKTPDDLLGFDLEGYAYDEGRSTENKPLFTRPARPQS